MLMADVFSGKKYQADDESSHFLLRVVSRQMPQKGSVSTGILWECRSIWRLKIILNPTPPPPKKKKHIWWLTCGWNFYHLPLVLWRAHREVGTVLKLHASCEFWFTLSLCKNLTCTTSNYGIQSTLSNISRPHIFHFTWNHELMGTSFRLLRKHELESPFLTPSCCVILKKKKQDRPQAQRLKEHQVLQETNEMKAGCNTPSFWCREILILGMIVYHCPYTTTWTVR